VGNAGHALREGAEHLGESAAARTAAAVDEGLDGEEARAKFCTAAETHATMLCASIVFVAHRRLSFFASRRAAI
jgi:hypothetical protein